MTAARGLRIGIFGSYNRSSIGDQAILDGILAQLRARLEAPAFVVFSLDPARTQAMLQKSSDLRVVPARPERGVRSVGAALRRRLRGFWRAGAEDLALIGRLGFWRAVRREIGQLDILLIGGGNLLMDLYPSWPILPLIFTLLARSAGVPCMFYAVGAGPLQSRRGRLYLRWACRLAGGLSFRDEASLELVATRLGQRRERLRLSADPALCLTPPRREPRPAGGAPRVAMSVVPYFKTGYWPGPDAAVFDRYARDMAALIEGLVDRFGVDLILFATNHPPDLDAAREILARLSDPSRVHLIDEPLGVQEILALLAGCDFAIGTRLHALILALLAETPSLALAYQPKVRSFYERIGLARFARDLRPDAALDVEAVLRDFETLRQNGDAVRDQLRQVRLMLCESAEESAEIAIRLARRMG